MSQKISVVVLTKNSQKHINKCLYSILIQKYPNFEVLIVDSNSNDGTYDILSEYRSLVNEKKSLIDEYNYILQRALEENFDLKRKKRIEPILNSSCSLFSIIKSVPSNISIGKARQIGLEESKGDIIAYIDSDVELPHENWLNNMVTPLIEGYNSIPKEHIAGVQTLSKNKDTDPWILKYLHYGFEYKNNVIDIEHYKPVGTGHLLIRKDCIQYVAGFRDIHSHEDIDVTTKIMLKGYKFIYLPSEKVYHYHVDGLWHYIKKHLIRNKILALRRIFFERE